MFLLLESLPVPHKPLLVHIHGPHDPSKHWGIPSEVDMKTKQVMKTKKAPDERQSIQMSLIFQLLIETREQRSTFAGLGKQQSKQYS